MSDFEKGTIEESYNKKQVLNTGSKILLVFLWLINLIFGLLLLAWPMGLIMSIFLFDAPGSTESLLLNITAWSIWTYPVTYLIALVGSILLYKKNYRTASILFASLPIINIIGVGLIALW